MTRLFSYQKGALILKIVRIHYDNSYHFSIIYKKYNCRNIAVILISYTRQDISYLVKFSIFIEKPIINNAILSICVYATAALLLLAIRR